MEAHKYVTQSWVFSLIVNMKHEIPSGMRDRVQTLENFLMSTNGLDKVQPHEGEAQFLALSAPVLFLLFSPTLPSLIPCQAVLEVW